MELRFGLMMKYLPSPKLLGVTLPRFPARVSTELMFRLAFKAFLRNVREDVPIWDRKQYLPEPALLENDGPIMDFRAWARQFYPDPASERVATDDGGLVQIRACRSR